MFTALQLTHWLPAEYIDGPVPLVHLPHRGVPMSRFRLPQVKWLSSLDWFGKGMRSSAMRWSGNTYGQAATTVPLVEES